MNPIIKIENLSKMYRLGVIGTGTISHDLNRWWHKVRGKEDPYLKIGEANVSDNKSSSGYVWALKDINIEVMPGEVLGIIGKNGAGKSTLLKILSRVTGPTTGSISYRGRIGSLLEVGTGFHGELTGRENIFLNGAILGMTKAEIRGKLDEIVDFAGVERYIDTPVKRYSSGMKVRLGFAVAAHLEPEILVVDEVLAVGDAEFQTKAIGKMQDVSKNEGRTILFVSHNMAAVKSLCTRGIVLKNGSIDFKGTANEAVDNYIMGADQDKRTEKKWNIENAPGNENIKLLNIQVKPVDGNIISTLTDFKISYEFLNNKQEINLGTTIEIITKDDIIILHRGIKLSENRDSKFGVYKIDWHIPGKLLNANSFRLKLYFGENQKYPLFVIDDIMHFEIINENYDKETSNRIVPGIIKPDLTYNIDFSEV